MAALGVRIAAAMVLAVIGLSLIMCGVGFLVFALAAALAPSLGTAGGAAVAGAVFVLPPFLWAAIFLLLRRTPPAKPATTASSGLWLTLFAAIAKETPWIAIAGAGVVAAAEMFLARKLRK